MQDRVRLEPAGFQRRIPLRPSQMTAAITPVDDVIVLCHLGVPRISESEWSLTFDGLVECPLRLKLADLKRFEHVRLEAVHQCAGIPTQPRTATRRISNVVWGGVRLADVLAEAAPKSDASFVWSYGADWGEFEGVTTDAYQKDLPLQRALNDDVLLACEMNGQPLRPENGFPVRLVVPGYFGTNSVKWLSRMTVAGSRATGPFVTRWYNDPVLFASGRETSATRPVWSLHPEAVIVAPGPGHRLAAGVPSTIVGWAFGDREIVRVDVRIGPTGGWLAANLERRHQRSWQRFELPWTPEHAGDVEICVRATDAAGQSQPPEGWRNAWHNVGITVLA